MDEAESLAGFANALNAVAEKPYDVSTHVQHIQFARSMEGMEAEVQSALEMMSQFMAAGDEVWLPLLQAKENAVDLETEGGVNDLLELYERAESDYLSIPILQRHLNFLFDQHALYISGERLKPDSLGNVFSTTWTREAISDVVKKAEIHLTESQKLWDLQRDWELERLEATPKSERSNTVEYVQNLILNRLQQPHLGIEETFQSYSSFTTNYLPAQDYESLLVAGSRIRAGSSKNMDRKERFETGIRQTQGSLESYNVYIGHERRSKYPDVFTTRGIYERAISEAAKRRFSGEPGAEEALRVFWSGYCDALRILNAGAELELVTYRRAVRSVPGSGEVWARYIRFLERIHSLDEVPEDLETVPDVFNRAISTKLLQADIEQLIPLVFARAGYEKRRLEAGIDEEALPTLIGVLETGIGMIYQSSKTSIDSKLRLEKLLASIYENVGLVDSAIGVWTSAAQQSKSSYQLWLLSTEALIKNSRFDEARQIFLEVHSKALDWPEALWEAWVAFEHLHGSLEDIETAFDKIEVAQYHTNMRRAKEYNQQIKLVAEAQANVSVAEAPIPNVSSGTLVPDTGVAMDVDQPQVDRGTKRGADEEGSLESHKKARIEQKPPPLKRDRENSTVFVSDLSDDISEEDVRALFKDCGSIREIKITPLSNTFVATVEFFDRDSIPAALTKDKKRIRDHEVSVNLAWKSTLYVTNFPESADDSLMRNMFGKYGTIFEIRWPSKKFKNTRRFCYVQFTSPEAAKNSLELHGRELEPNLPLNVYISNPERKKERTDQDANEREVYVAGLNKFTTKGDLEKIFTTYGPVKEVRIALEDNGQAKGFAFVEFEEPKDAQAALAANNHELKKRRIAVTLSDPRVRSRHKSEFERSERKDRSLRIKNLPPATQEGLLQQVLEKLAPVKRVEVFQDKQEAIVELEHAADVGKLLLMAEPIVFGGNLLGVVEDVLGSTRATGSSKESNKLFKPRHLGPSKPKAGLGFKKSGPVAAQRAVAETTMSSASSSSTGAKGQDDFRKMLARK